MSFFIPYTVYAVLITFAEYHWDSETACMYCLMFILAEIIQIKGKL